MNEIKKKEKKSKTENRKNIPDRVIDSEWLTYEELDKRVKKTIPALDESNIKTFLIEKHFLKKNEECINYYER